MATAKATFTINNFPDGKEHTINKVHLFGTVAITASPDTYATNGLPLSFQGTEVYSQGTVVAAWFSGLSGYDYSYDKVHGTIRMYTGGTETANGASIPSGVSGDTITAEAILDRSA